MRANGVSLPYLLNQAGMLSGATSIKFTSSDGYHITLTYDQALGMRTSFSSHSPGGSSGATTVEPIIAWEWGDRNAMPENIRPFFGQSGPMDVNTASFVRDLELIEVFTTPVNVWASPEASAADGSAVPAGTELSLFHENMDNVRIYYTTDGSEPNYYSEVYNRSTSFFQPHLIVPLILTEDVTIKAFAAGAGRAASPVVTFTFTIQ